MTWHPLATGPHAGKTLPEVFFTDPDYLFDGIEASVFSGAMLAEAAEVCRLATRIRSPRGEDEEQEAVVLYHLLPDRRSAGSSSSPSRTLDWPSTSASRRLGPKAST